MVLASERLVYAFWRHVTHDCLAGLVSHSWICIMQRQQEGPEGLWPNLRKAVGAFASYLAAFVLSETLYEHQLALRTEVLDAEKCAAPDLFVFVT